MSLSRTAHRSRRRALLLIGPALLVLAGCETATPYQPQMHGNQVSGGYRDQQIEANRFRVMFNGNSMTSRETVETYLLYRAAELTVQHGYDWFEMADRQTDRKSNTYIDRPFGPGPWGYWGPSWRYYGGGFGWRSWDPFWGDPFWDSSVNVQTVDRYEASAEIVTYHGPKPPDNPRAFDARDVINRLGPTIVAPR
jgi:hypothetical protein